MINLKWKDYVQYECLNFKTKLGKNKYQLLLFSFYFKYLPKFNIIDVSYVKLIKIFRIINKSELSGT